MRTPLMFFLKQLATFTSCAGGRKLFILIYHQVLDGYDFMRPCEVDIARFSWQMELLAKHFNVLPLAEGLDRLGDGSLPPRAVSITFDDGYANNYHNALPVLRRFGLSATFFIASGYLDGGRMWNDTVIEAIRAMAGPVLDLSALDLGRHGIATPAQKADAAKQVIGAIKHLDFDRRQAYVRHLEAQAQGPLPTDMMMTCGQVKALAAAGMDIGGHTVNHPILANLPDHQVSAEIDGNKAFLEQLLERPCRLFAYPNGKRGRDYVPAQAALVRASGYGAALTTEWGVAGSTTDRWQLPRFTPWDGHPLTFMWRMVGHYLHPSSS